MQIHSLNLELWPVRSVLALDAAQLRAQWREPAVTLLADAVTGLADVLAAVTKVADLGPRVTVRIQKADPETLQALARAGAAAVEWLVLAPTTGAALARSGETDEADALQHAISAAEDAGLAVRLRWPVSQQTVAGLGELDQLGGFATPVTVVVLPELDPARAPHPGHVTAAWPVRVADGVELVTSALWPHCVGGSVRESARQQERALAAAQPVGACASCPWQQSAALPDGCAGVPAALRARLQTDDAGQAWQAWRARPAAARATVHIDGTCVEARALALGLRRGWRLVLPESQLPEFRSIFEAQGWTVQVIDAVDTGTGGQMRAVADSRSLLVVVATSEAVAAAVAEAERAVLRDRQLSGDVDLAVLWQTQAHHRLLGESYGYPACCVEAFLDARAELAEYYHETDNALAVLRVALRSRSFDPRLAALPGPFGEEARTPLRHIPCRFDCPASQALADVLLADLAVSNPSWTARARAMPIAQEVLFADGSFLQVYGRPRGSGEVAAITRLQACVSQAAPAELPAALDALIAAAPRALRVEPGLGLSCDCGDGWRPWPLPAVPGPRAEAFPLLLPFAEPEA